MTSYQTLTLVLMTLIVFKSTDQVVLVLLCAKTSQVPFLKVRQGLWFWKNHRVEVPSHGFKGIYYQYGM